MWSREQCERLIDGYRKHPNLYNVKSHLYKNKHARQKALEDISKDLHDIMSNVTIHDIKTKFSSLKQNFQRNIKSGAGEDSLSDPTPTSVSSKLSENGNKRKIDEILIEAEEDSLSKSILKPLSTSTIAKPLEKRKKRKMEFDEGNAVLKDASKVLKAFSESVAIANEEDAKKKTEPKHENSTEAFTNFIKSKMKEIKSDKIRLETEEKITLLLFRAIREDKNYI
ncbi:hypothetical protein ABEB36_014439 [Hypothenemus hampei]|uniref:MADF domain-containing protein n=1 Tax=Hypothenemus hampei TaxID=57062 RepID=A0ABD1E233_HYPHA